MLAAALLRLGEMGGDFGFGLVVRHDLGLACAPVRHGDGIERLACGRVLEGRPVGRVVVVGIDVRGDSGQRDAAVAAFKADEKLRFPVVWRRNQLALVIEVFGGNVDVLDAGINVEG